VDDLERLAADFAAVGRKLGTGLGREVKSAGERARDDWRQRVRERAGRRLRHLPSSITSSVNVELGYMEAEVGPDKNRRQGPLGNIVEFGTSRHGPIAPAREAVADAEESRFTKAVLDVAEGLL
jgi:hypothetical protein